jgi:hypothetical protein
MYFYLTVSFICYGYFELFISTFSLPCFDACISSDSLLSEQNLRFITFAILSNCFLLYVM